MLSFVLSILLKFVLMQVDLTFSRIITLLSLRFIILLLITHPIRRASAGGVGRRKYSMVDVGIVHGHSLKILNNSLKTHGISMMFTDFESLKNCHPGGAQPRSLLAWSRGGLVNGGHYSA